MTMPVDVRLASALRPHAGGAATVRVAVPGDGTPTVKAVLDAIAADHPGIGWRVRDEQGGVRRHVNVFVGAEPIRELGGVDAVIPPGAELFILPAVSGGGR